MAPLDATAYSECSEVLAEPFKRDKVAPIMDTSIGSQYDELREEVRSFFAANEDVAVPAGPGFGGDASEVRNRVVKWQKRLVDAGYAGREIPQRYGGAGHEPDALASLVIEEEFQNAGLSLGMENQGISMFVPTLLHFGREDQKQDLISPTIRGELIWCQGYSEPGSGSDLASLRTSAVLDGDEYVINGQKIWTSGAREADMMFALIRTEAEAGKHGGISYLVLSMDTPGLDVRPLMTMTGDASFNEVFFTDVRVPATNVIGRPGQGWEVGTYTLRFERNMLGRSNATENYLAGCVDILRETGLIDSPVYRDRLLKLEGRVQAMKYHQLRLLTDRLKKRDSGAGGLIVKLNNCQLNYDVCDLAIDAMAERGVLRRGSKHVRDYGNWQRNYMYALGLIIGGGTAQIQKNIIGERGLGLPREPKPAAA